MWKLSLILCPLDGDMTEADRKKVQVERQRRAALRSSVIQELRQQYSDAPEEIRDRRDFQSERESRDDLHRFLLLLSYIYLSYISRQKACRELCRVFQTSLLKIFCSSGKSMRSQWWCVSTCQSVIRTPEREARWRWPASWAGSHTSVTSARWQARAGRWGKLLHVKMYTSWSRHPQLIVNLLFHGFRLKQTFTSWIWLDAVVIPTLWLELIYVRDQKKNKYKFIVNLTVMQLWLPPKTRQCWPLVVLKRGQACFAGGAHAFRYPDVSVF